jgi:hypothetical protein
VTIPGHPGDDLPTGTLKSIQRAAGVEKRPTDEEQTSRVRAFRKGFPRELVAIIRKRLQLDASLYQILQIFSFNLFEKTPLYRCFKRAPPKPTYPQILTS